jgi:hypothetical protein
MRFNKLYEKKLNPEQTAVSSGVQTLGTDQWMGTYKFSKDVAGHDGEKQHAPDSPSGNDVYTDKAIVVGYSDTDDKMTKAAMNGKVKQTVGSGSEEPENVNAKSPLSKNEDVSKGLPDHLKKHFDKDGNPIKGSWKDGKWTPNKDSEYQVKDVTPKGYGPTEDVEEAQNIYHLNRTGFARGPRDSERHDLDVSRTSPQEWALKINGKVWSKDGKTVTFNSKEQALKVRQSLLAKRPELEVGLVTRGGTTEAQGDIDVDTYADALIKRDKQNLSRRNVAHAARIAGVDEKKLLTAIQLKVGRIKEEADLDEDVGAEIADLIRKKNSASSPVARRNIDSQIAQLKRQRDKMNEEQGVGEGYTVTRGIDRDRYQERTGLEGPFSAKNGKVVYYDKAEGKYYDTDTDMYIDHDDWQAMNEQGVEEAHGNSKIYDKCWTGYRKVPGKKRGEDGSCEKIGEAEVRHDRYMRSHGKKASSGGHGSWMFTNKEYGEPSDDETFTAPPGKFSDAVKHAKKWAKEKGHYSVYAMEDGLDEASLATMRDFFAGDEEAHDPYEITKQRLHFSKDNDAKTTVDKRFPSKQAYLTWLQQQKQTTKADTVDEDVIYRLDKENPMNDTEVLVIGGAGRYSLDGLRAKARREAEQLAKDLTVDHGGAFRKSAHNVRQLQNTLNTIVAAYDELNQLRKLGGMRSKGIKDEDATVMREGVELMEKWTQKYKNSINCSDPKGFSQKAHCAGKKK